MRRDNEAGKSESHDHVILTSVAQWFRECLGCVPGQREFNVGRYVYGLVRQEEEARRLVEIFRQRASLFLAAGCLLIFPDLDTTGEEGDVRAILTQIGALVAAALGLSVPSVHGHGKSLTANVMLRCPVTGQLVQFDDFDAIAFLPAAGNSSSPLYDPNIEAPFVCVNFTSDLYGFSLFTRDRAHALYGCEVWEIQNLQQLTCLFLAAAQLWQQLALKTIQRFASRTQADKLCPIYASQDQRHWFAMHEDAAFGEMEKHLH